MPPSTYIDIHRHEGLTEPDKDTWTLFNKHENFSVRTSGKQYSIGIHPWYIEEDATTQFETIQQQAIDLHIMAIGECGLDTVKGAPLGIQMAVFEKQVQLANTINKPLIIHCVKAFPQALSLLKQAKVPVIFHGFNKRLSIADAILEQGYYLSFGAALLKEASAASAVLAGVPKDCFFLETDDAVVNIKAIYKAASLIRKTAEDAIILQVQENFKTIFNL
jgi:TatD DNase family protein